MPTIEWIAVDTVKPNARNARTHSKKQIRQIADSITAFGFVVPILVDEGRVVIAGHGRYAAAKLLGFEPRFTDIVHELRAKIAEVRKA